MTSVSETRAQARPSTIFVRYGTFLFRYRDGVFLIVMLALVIATAPRWPGGSDRLDDVLDLFGIVIASLGQILRAAVIGYAYIVRGGKNKRVYAAELVTGGFFAHARNPLYLGNLLVILGLLTIWNNPIAYVVGIAFYVSGYAAIVAAEEEFLLGKFGSEYEEYRARTPRWMIRLAGLRRTMGEMTYQWRRVIRKEYGSTAAWMLGAGVLLLGDSLYYQPWGARPAYHTAIVVSMAIVAVLWASARYLKKTGRLRDQPSPA
ncbi:MAG TPA: isoprenylcysteine carboxylmethyltransferase family protein [Gemmatimonadaceae bacterium]|nr:isoprenylcysteine carboxylmethyltransferase family protein [Gemmatimonadaceae bacterium]